VSLGRANFDTDMLFIKRTLLEMRKDRLQRGLPALDEAYTKYSQVSGL
jgi:hypothetical protein